MSDPPDAARGLPLHVTELGLPEGPDTETHVLLHGFGGTSFGWRHWTPSLAERAHVVLVDLKGFGEAPKPDDDKYSPIDFAELVVALIDRRGFERVTLIGHSLGGGVTLLAALTLAARAHNPLQRMVIVAGAAYEQRLPPFVAFARYPRFSGWLLRSLGPRFVIRHVLRGIVYDSSTVEPDQVVAYARPLESSDGVRAMLLAATQMVPANLREITARFPQLRVPALLIWGRHDRVVPLAIGERLAGDLPRARLVVVEQCGHIPPEEEPAGTLAELLGFLDE